VDLAEELQLKNNYKSEMKGILLILICFSAPLLSQTITPSVINSGGRTHTVTLNSDTIYLTDNIGEAIINTANNNSNMLTQGFLQPDVKVVSAASVTVLGTDVSCADKADGIIRVIVENAPLGSEIQYMWTPSSLCPANNCNRIDNLSAGSFSVQVKINYTVNSVPKSDSTFHVIQIKDNGGPCRLQVYTGVQLSGTNSTFTIDNIEEFPEATVSIFNRWGSLLFSSKSYHNVDNAWPKKNENIAPGTYFYVIDTGNGKPLKGWLEVLQ
jgi:gliding motility-associated-like protein